MAEPTYDEMSKQLQFSVDRHTSGHTDGLDMFIVQSLFILTKLMADVQKMQEKMDGLDIAAFKPSVN